MAKRRTQWIDAINSTPTDVAGIINVDEALVSESELENVGGASTITRVVGEIWIHSLLVVPVAGWTIWLHGVYVGSVTLTLWDIDTFQRQRVMATGWFMAGGHT